MGHASPEEAAEMVALLDALRMENWEDEAQELRVLRWFRVRKIYLDARAESAYQRGYSAGKRKAQANFAAGQ